MINKKVNYQNYHQNKNQKYWEMIQSEIKIKIIKKIVNLYNKVKVDLQNCKNIEIFFIFLSQII